MSVTVATGEVKSEPHASAPRSAKDASGVELGVSCSVPEEAENTVELSVVMPCLNEVKTVGICVRKAMESIERNGLSAEVIVADNGSTDGSQALAESLGARVVRVPRRGYGAALACGIEAARGKYVLMADSDDSYDLGNLVPFVERLRAGDDLVMGNRFKGGIEPGAMPPLHRYFGNPLLTFIGRLFFRSRCGDFYCGQRAFRRDAVLGLDLQGTGMEFALEMLVKATMHELKVGEVPVTLKPDGRGRAPHLRSWRDGWRSLRFYLLFSPKWLFLYPGLVLMTVGALLGTLILFEPLEVGRLRLDVHTLVFCGAAVVIGFQLAMLSACAKMLAIATGLHPRRPNVERWLRGAPLELGLIAAAVLVAIGVGLAGWAVWRWAGTDFRSLDPFSVMRLVVPASVLLTLGFQVGFSSFYASLLQIQCRRVGRWGD